MIRNLPEVVEVHEDRGATIIHTREPERVLLTLLSLDPDLSGLEVSGAGLEEAFLALTREKTN
jgi:ABC-2 type transport system ATP-binding protein